MKKETIVVPKEINPVEVIAITSPKVRKAWVFMHENVISEFEKDQKSQEVIHLDDKTVSYKWKKTKNHPEVIVEVSTMKILGKTWYPVVFLKSPDVTYKAPNDPKSIFFFKMEQ